MRHRLKRLVESTIVGSGLPWLATRWRGGNDLILAYHNIVPHGEEPGADSSLHVPQRTFVSHLDALLEVATVVPLDEILRPRQTARRRVAVTFDDAYQGAVQAGMVELAARGLPATVFVTPGMLGGRTFWWDRFPDSAGRHDVWQEAIVTLGGDDERISSAFRARGWSEIQPPSHARGADLASLKSALNAGRVLLGAHTWSHPNLGAVDAATLEDELVRPLEWLRDHFPESTRPWIAYPYGSHTETVREQSARVGYQWGFRVEGGRLQRPLDPSSIPRLNVTAGLSPRGLILRASGLAS